MRDVVDSEGNGAVKPPSLRDVARTAGVSVSTASRVLSDSSHAVSVGTRARVLEAADGLGFQPNRLARALATARSHTIGVVVHDVSDPYFGGIIRGLEDVAGERDHAILVTSSDRDRAKELALVQALASYRVDAIVLAASGLVAPGYAEELAAPLERFRRLGGAVVALSETSVDVPRVHLDNAGAIREITRHLLELGHRRIGYITGPPELAVSGVRLAGFWEAVGGAGLAPDPSLVESGWFTMGGGAAAAEALLRRHDLTALVAANDLMAMGAMRHLVGSGLRVPHDMSVAGMDDIEFAAYATVPLTTVRVPLTELGRLGAGLAFDLLAGHPPVRYAVEGALVVRASTGPATR